LLVRREGELARFVLGHFVSAATKPRLKVSREGLVLIKSFEGFRPRAVQGPDGGWAVGYGHTAYAREGLTLSERDAELLLRYDLLPVAKALNDGVTAPLNQHQFDALASFAHSIGLERFLSSDVLQRFNSGQPGQAAEALIGWPETPAPDAALRRRAAERALFTADPATPVHLLDLLTAPLLQPAVAEVEAPSQITSGAVAARAAAILLGERRDTPAEPADPPAAFPSAPVEAGPDRYSPYATTVAGALPGFPPIGAADASAPSAPAPTMDPPRILAPAPEDDAIEPPASSTDEDSAPSSDQPPASVLRHEVEAPPARRFDWIETGPYLIMGGLGLIACGAAAAAVRKAMIDASAFGDYALIAGVLAFIGLLCVGVSAWNLHVRSRRPD
jgi:lysozyme